MKWLSFQVEQTGPEEKEEEDRGIPFPERWTQLKKDKLGTGYAWPWG